MFSNRKSKQKVEKNKLRMKKIKKKPIKNLNLSFDELISTDKRRETSLQNSFFS